MRGKFKQRLEENKMVTEESIANYSKNKTYHNGHAVIVGDKPLFGMMLDIDENENKNLTLIMLCEEQLYLYELDDRDTRDVAHIPMIKLK